MGKWTQGPWAVFAEEADKPYIRIRGTLLGRRFKVANVCAPEWDIDESRANARLIAAAPELVEALRTARDYVFSELETERQQMNGYERISRIDEIAADLAEIDAALAKAGAKDATA